MKSILWFVGLYIRDTEVCVLKVYLSELIIKKILVLLTLKRNVVFLKNVITSLTFITVKFIFGVLIREKVFTKQCCYNRSI